MWSICESRSTTLKSHAGHIEYIPPLQRDLEVSNAMKLSSISVKALSRNYQT